MLDRKKYMKEYRKTYVHKKPYEKQYLERKERVEKFFKELGKGKVAVILRGHR